MTLQSHIMLGKYLLERYLKQTSFLNQQAFLLGCQFPDRNPTTYLKGSLKNELLRGHNFENARPFIEKLCTRMKKSAFCTPFDYYTLGKIMHYIADAFTFCHNSAFKGDLKQHRAYERNLECIIEASLQKEIRCATIWKNDPFGTILFNHRDYLIEAGQPYCDAIHTIKVSCAVMEILLCGKAGHLLKD